MSRRNALLSVCAGSIAGAAALACVSPLASGCSEHFPAVETNDGPLPRIDGSVPASADAHDEDARPVRPTPLPSGPGEVLTSKNDNGRTGASFDEKVIDRTTVKQMQLVASLPVDGELYAQPLVVGGVTTTSGPKALAIIATMNDSVYAFDVDAPDGAPPIWHAGSDRELGLPGTSSRNVNGPNGILSTPVIDRKREVVWVVARDCSATEKTTFDRCGVSTQVPKCRERLLAIALGTGKVVGAVDVAGSAHTTTREVTFDPSVQWNRPALLLEDDGIFVSFGSGPNANDHEEDYEYHGWLFRYDATNIAAPPRIFNTSPQTSGASIWQAGAGPASDGTHVYFVTANDVLGCSTHLPEAFPASPADAEDSVVRLPTSFTSTDLRIAGTENTIVASTPNGGVSSFGDALVYSDTRPYTASGYTGTVFQFSNAGDNGFGSSGPTLIPDSRDLIAATKGGILYLLDRDTMRPLQAPLSPFDVLPLQGDHSLYLHSWWGIPPVPGSIAFYRRDDAHGLAFAWAKNDKLHSFRYDYAAHTLVPEKTAAFKELDTGGYLSITASTPRSSDAILWASTRSETDAVGGRVLAIDPLTLEKLWSVETPVFSKFTPLSVARGRVFVPSARYGKAYAVLVYAPATPP